MGNGTAVAIDIIPKLQYLGEDEKIVTDQVVCQRIESLKEGASEKISCMFVRDINHRVIRSILLDPRREKCPPDQSYIPAIELFILYKNVLGGSFRAKIRFNVWFYEEDEEKLKSLLKILETAKIDLANLIDEHNTLASPNSREAKKIRRQLNEELSKREGHQNIDFVSEPAVASFTVSPISEAEYSSAFRTGYPRRVQPPKRKK